MEYRSKSEWRGIPLVAISLRHQKRVIGIVAIGRVSIGVVAIGLVAIGPVSVGAVAVGVVAVGLSGADRSRSA